MAFTLTPSIPESETSGSEFQDNRGYKMKPSLKKNLLVLVLEQSCYIAKVGLESSCLNHDKHEPSYLAERYF